MEIAEGFFNKVAKEIDTKYFPNVKYYRDNKNTTDIHYAIELFNNGCLTYDKLIKRLSKSAKDTEENMRSVVDKYIVEF